MLTELTHGSKGGAGSSAPLVYITFIVIGITRGGGGSRFVYYLEPRDFYWFKMPAILPLTVFSTVVETVFSICPLTWPDTWLSLIHI